MRCVVLFKRRLEIAQNGPLSNPHYLRSSFISFDLEVKGPFLLTQNNGAVA